MSKKLDINSGSTGIRAELNKQSAGEELLLRRQAEIGFVAEGTPIIPNPGTKPFIHENVDFINRFDKTKVIPIVRPTKIVVVDQEPDPDMFIPAGTPVNIVMAFKEDLPVESFTNIETAVKNKYDSVGALLNDLEKENDPLAGGANKVLEEKPTAKYEDLTPQDKTSINNFIKNRFNVNPDTDAQQAKKVYENLRFLKTV